MAKLDELRELKKFDLEKAVRIIETLANERLRDFNSARVNGEPWNEKDILPTDSLLKLEGDWDYGWLMQLTAQLRGSHLLAFFARLATIDTAVQELVMSALDISYPELYRRMFYWDHTIVADAASCSYQRYRTSIHSETATDYINRFCTTV